jgi:hypothetical protein
VAISRRALGVGAAGVALAAALPLALRRRARASPVGLERDPQKLFDHLPGFEVHVLDRTGDIMSDGHLVPGMPDGMGTFAGPSGTIALLRNHELGTSDAAFSAYPGGPTPGEAYDPASFGGVTRLLIDPKTLAVVRSNLVLTGTARNCAGGWSPWGWLTCEEDVSEGHGFVFACDPAAEAVTAPKRIDAYGRFRHEAAAVDPETLVAYLTEDREDACFYRFVPRSKAAPFDGVLQALAVVGSERFDTSRMGVGERVQVRWVDVDEPTPKGDSVRGRAHAKGAAKIARGEGLYVSRLPSAPGGAAALEVWFTATSGGAGSRGQLFRLRPDGDGGVLEAAAVSSDSSVLDMPDNLVVAPTGHVFMAEDGVAPNGIKVLCPNGNLICLGVEAEGSTEIAGVCLSPDGEVLFANLQERGITIAIRGPLADLA